MTIFIFLKNAVSATPSPGRIDAGISFDAGIRIDAAPSSRQQQSAGFLPHSTHPHLNPITLSGKCLSSGVISVSLINACPALSVLAKLKLSCLGHD